MKRFLVIPVILGLLFMVGCLQAPVSLPSNGGETLPDSDDEVTDLDNLDGEPQPDETEVELSKEPPEDVTWISPGKVQVGNFYPGARAEWDLLVHNGNDTATSFAVAYRYPDHVGEGYIKPPLLAEDWVIIADTTPVLMPKETREILVVLAMPKDAIVFSPKWEFWISVKDTTQTGMVQTELCCRWLVTMRQ